MDSIEQLQTDLFLGEKWLKQMGEAASRYGLNLQYCMALPRQILAGLEIPAVTQVLYNLFAKPQQFIYIFTLYLLVRHHLTVNHLSLKAF